MSNVVESFQFGLDEEVYNYLQNWPELYGLYGQVAKSPDRPHCITVPCQLSALHRFYTIMILSFDNSSCFEMTHLVICVQFWTTFWQVSTLFPAEVSCNPIQQFYIHRNSILSRRRLGRRMKGRKVISSVGCHGVVYIKSTLQVFQQKLSMNHYQFKLSKENVIPPIYREYKNKYKC